MCWRGRVWKTISGFVQGAHITAEEASVACVVRVAQAASLQKDYPTVRAPVSPQEEASLREVIAKCS